MLDICFGPLAENLSFLAFGFGGLSFKAKIWPKVFTNSKNIMKFRNLISAESPQSYLHNDLKTGGTSVLFYSI